MECTKDSGKWYLWVVKMAQPTDPPGVGIGTVQDRVVLSDSCFLNGSNCRSSEEELKVVEAQGGDDGTTQEKHTQL